MKLVFKSVPELKWCYFVFTFDAFGSAWVEFVFHRNIIGTLIVGSESVSWLCQHCLDLNPASLIYSVTGGK